MPADYGKIRAENIARYGWDTAVLDLLGQLYSERTHFIFELIQNAEDAGATELAFELSGDRLELRHDGRPFTEADVRGVCGVGQSGKSADLTQIGQFGIGFKSVYAYTRTPRVHSGGEHFQIGNYVRPAATAPRDEPGTLFVFPFDHDEVRAPVAVAEISAALNALEPRTLLFLRNIRRISIRGAHMDDAVLDRTGQSRAARARTSTSTSQQVTLRKRRSSQKGSEQEEWLVWHRPLDSIGHPGQQAEIAFRASPGSGGQQLARCAEAPLVVFFPTQKETFLGFCVQGPYRTTPARDNVPEHDPANQAVAQQTALLLTSVLAELRDDGLLTVEVLEALPLDPVRFPPGALLRPLFDAVRAALAGQPLIPVHGGGFAAAGELILASDPGLRELLSPDQLGLLYHRPAARRRGSFPQRTPRPPAVPLPAGGTRGR